MPSFPAETQALLCRYVKQNWASLNECDLALAQLIQESGLDPNACSGVGACGLGQFMPATWHDQIRLLKLDPTLPRSDIKAGIEIYTIYQAMQDRIWKANRTPLEAHQPGLASYNAGAGNIIKAQAACMDAHQWAEIVPCLSTITGIANAKQTSDYVLKINQRWAIITAGK